MSHLELIADADALIERQKLKVVRVQPASGPADGRDIVELTRDEFGELRRLARLKGMGLEAGNVTLSREESSRLAHALRQSPLTPTVRRVLLVLGKNCGLIVSGVE